MRSASSRTGVVVLFAIVAAGSAACGDDGGGGPVAPTTVAPTTAAQADAAAAQRSMDAWLVLVDAGDYAAAYAAAGSFLREQVTADEFRNALQEGRAQLGVVESRTLGSTRRATTVPYTLPDGTSATAPPGDYFVFEFDTDYAMRPDTVERVTAVSEAGGWSVVGYWIVR